MKKIIKIFACGLVIVSCNKEQGQEQLAQNAQTQPDIIQLLVDNPRRFAEESGIESLIDDLQLTEEQRQAYHEEKEIMMQMFMNSTDTMKLSKKKALTKNLDVNENDLIMNDIFQSLTELVAMYSNYKGASEQWIQASDNLIMGMGELCKELAEASLVVDLNNLIVEKFTEYKNDVSKYALTEGEYLQFSDMISNIQKVFLDETFLGDIQHSKIGNSTNPLTKGFFTFLKKTFVTAVIVTVTAVAAVAGTYVAGPIGGLALGYLSLHIFQSYGALAEGW